MLDLVPLAILISVWVVLWVIARPLLTGRSRSSHTEDEEDEALTRSRRRRIVPPRGTPGGSRSR